MRTKTKALVLALCAVLLVVATVFVTMAYLTSTTEVVTNTFTVGNVKITLDEEDVDTDTNTDDNVTVNNEVRDLANGYKLIPGKTYVKDPTVHVDATSENCYLFVKVENNISAIEAETNNIEAQMKAKGWTCIDEFNNIWAHNDIAKASNDVVVFEYFTVDDSIDNNTLAGYQDKTIVVTAYAVQADGFEGKETIEIWNTAFGN